MNLPQQYLITPNPDESEQEQFIFQLEKSLINGVRLVQLRAKNLSIEKYLELAKRAVACCKRYDALLLLNADPTLVDQTDANGVHLDGARLAAYNSRPLGSNKLISAACHSLQQVKKTESLGVDWVTLSPVLPTESHPGAETLGWESFSAIAGATKLPVYALGGMNAQLLMLAKQNGAYGVAGIRGFWCS